MLIRCRCASRGGCWSLGPTWRFRCLPWHLWCSWTCLMLLWLLPVTLLSNSGSPFGCHSLAARWYPRLVCSEERKVLKRDSLMICSIRTMFFVWHPIPSSDYKGLWTRADKMQAGCISQSCSSMRDATTVWCKLSSFWLSHVVAQIYQTELGSGEASMPNCWSQNTEMPPVCSINFISLSIGSTSRLSGKDRVCLFTVLTGFP